MRCYHFGNFYLSSIQQGIQAAHAQMELFVKYRENICVDYDNTNPAIEECEYQQQVDDLFDWAYNHKTMVCLNGGALGDLKNIEELMKDSENKYPWSTFYEDEYSLGAILTNIAIVLPEEIYDTAAKIRSGDYILYSNRCYDKYCFDISNPVNSKVVLTQFETKLIQLLNSCQLAR